MYRTAIEKLWKWKQSKRRKPLIIEGARQVGKTWLMKEFGRLAYEDTVYINFDSNAIMTELFAADLDTKRLMMGLELYIGHKINPDNTLLIFDEIGRGTATFDGMALAQSIIEYIASKTRAKWGGFSLKWYVSLFDNEQILQALYNTLLIALLSALIATVIGTMASIALHSMKSRTRTFWMSMANIPMLNAEIVTGISLMLLFIAAGNFLSMFGASLTFGFGTILIGHITFNLPYVILSVMPKLRQVNISTYEAALDIGASPLYAFFKVVLPDIMPGVLSGFLLAFTLSLDDFIITHFVKGPGVDTLSTKIYSEVRKGIKPEMYALSTLVFVAVLLLLFIINYKPKKKTNEVARA